MYRALARLPCLGGAIYIKEREREREREREARRPSLPAPPHLLTQNCPAVALPGSPARPMGECICGGVCGSESPDQPLFNPSKASSSSASTQSTDLLRRYRSPKPPCIAGATGSNGAPHRSVFRPLRMTTSTTRACTPILLRLLHLEMIYRTGRSSILKTIGTFPDVPRSTWRPPTRRPTPRRPSTRRPAYSTHPRSVTHLPSMHTGPAVASSHPPRPALPPADRSSLHSG